MGERAESKNRSRNEENRGTNILFSDVFQLKFVNISHTQESETNELFQAQAEQMKANAQERMVEKLALTRRRVVEKQTKAEAKRNQLAVRAAQQVEQIRNTGHMPKSHHHRCCSWIL